MLAVNLFQIIGITFNFKNLPLYQIIKWSQALKVLLTILEESSSTSARVNTITVL